MKQYYLKSILLFYLGLFASSFVVAQDPVFSQFFINSTYLNPSLTGFRYGTEVISHYRNQWYNVRQGYSKFETRNVSLSTCLPTFYSGLGLMYVDNIEGEGYLKSQKYVATYAYEVLPHRKSRAENADNRVFRLGMNLSYNTRQVNWDKFVFTNQLDPIHGVVLPSSLVSNNNILVAKNYIDADFGTAFGLRSINIGTKKMFSNLLMGFSISHLTRPNISLISADERLPWRYSVHLSGAYNLNWRMPNNAEMYLVPVLKIDWQKKSANKNPTQFMNANYGVLLGMKNFSFGAYMQNKKVFPDTYNTNNLILLTGFQFETGNIPIQFTLSKDLSLNAVGSDTGGAWEASLIIRAKKITPDTPIHNHNDVPCRSPLPLIDW
jgi:type IX secretion system PorP/SprF family membrane protein